MKKNILLVTGLLLSCASFGQWTTSGTNIYNSNTGVVGIGTGASFSGFKLEVVGNGQILRNTTSTSYTSLRLYNNQNLATRALEIDYSGSSFATPLLSGGPTGEAGSITTTGSYPLLFGTGNSLRMMINSVGNVGIGTATATDRLEVSSTTSNNITAMVGTDVQTGFRARKTGTNATDWQLYVPAGSTSFRFYNATVGADVLSLTNTGNVGIGTTSPGTKLEVNGVIRMTANNYNYLQLGAFNASTDNFAYISAGGQTAGTGLKFETTNGGGTAAGVTRMMITNDGSVGINTTPNGSFRLDVNGQTMVRGNLSLEAGTDPVIYTGTGTGEMNRYAQLINSPSYGSASGLKAGGILVADTYAYGNPGKNDLIVKGNVGVGTASPDAKLTVNGTVHAKEVKVDLNVPGPDYVFDKDYRLLSLDDVRAYIEKHHHLPDVQSAAEMEMNGISVSEMNMTLLKKVEELTLYIINTEMRLRSIEQELKAALQSNKK